ncbi:GAS2 protein 1 [Fasciola hepatica]|uniref:GAS2 protein 1 n=1 Tax=Fasciola hepatica TaxID=6192 RepID=A0A4E0S342_FASHE|nr:GAS2 protein 1 [Fasciola hepatica]
MATGTKNTNRASSLPPSCLPYEDRIYELNVSLDVSSAQSIRDVATGMRSHPSGACRDCVGHGSEILLHSAKVSPSDSSGITDEDSGYFQTNSLSSRRLGSSNSIATSGQLNYEGSGSFVNRDELLQVMTEDLVDWFIQMYPTQAEDLTVENFFDRLSDGVLLCHHVAELHQRLAEQCELSTKAGRTRLVGVRVGGAQAVLPSRYPVYQTRGLNSSNATSAFVSRDNVSNFLAWCRQLGMPDCVLFESEDLVCRKNPRNVAVCLLELARLGGRVGMAIPELIQLEAEIDEEIACESYGNDDRINQTHSSSCSSITEQDYAIRSRRKSEGSHLSTGKGVISKDRQNKGIMDDANDCYADNDSNSNNREKNGAYRTTRTAELRLLRNKRLRSNSRSTICADSKQIGDNVKRKPEIQRPLVDLRTLDEIVRDLLSQCTCKQTFPMIRVSEGRYLFGDKCTQIFVRILRNHVMVRVGGGWDTLNHFLTKYDECRKVNPPNCRVSNGACTSSSSTASCVDANDPQSVLNALEATDSLSPLITDGPIRGEGKLTAVKKSPPLEECGPIRKICPADSKLQTISNSGSAKTVTKPQNGPPRTRDSLSRQEKNTSQENVSPAVGRQSNLTNVPQMKLVSPTAKTNPSARAARSQDIRPITENFHSSLNRVSTRTTLADCLRTSHTSTEDEHGVKFPTHNRVDATVDEKRSNLARRALASAPRTPVSNRSRNSSPGRLKSFHSKSTTNLVSCGVPQKINTHNRQIAQHPIRMTRRCSEQPAQPYQLRSTFTTGSQPGKLTSTPEERSRSGFRSDKTGLPTGRSLSITDGTKENKSRSGLTSPSSPSEVKTRLPAVLCENQPCGNPVQRGQTDNRRPSLIPRLIRRRSVSQISSVTAVEFDSLPEYL